MPSILYISNYKPNSGGISNVVRDYLEKVPQLGFQVDLFNTRRNNLIRPILIFSLVFQCRKHDIIHIHGCSYRGFFPIALGVLAHKFSGKKKLVISYHGGGAETYFNTNTKLKIWFMKQADEVIVMSPFLNKVFTQIKINTTIIPNGIEIKQTPPRERSNFNPHLVSIRSLTPNYNISDIIQTTGLIQKKYPNTKLTVLGGGSELNALMQQVHDEGINNIEFKGLVTQEVVQKTLKNNDIFITVPSEDNQPLSILEAFNNGIPVIATSVGGVNDLITDHKTGYLVEVNHPEQIAEKITYILNNTDQTNCLVREAYDSLANYSWNTILSELNSMYNGK